MIFFPISSGQLCNQLFCIAHMAAASMETGISSAFPAFGYPLDLFPNLNTNPLVRVCEERRGLWRARALAYYALFRLLPSSPWHACLVRDRPPFIDLASPEIAALAKSKVVLCRGWGLRAIDALAKHRNAVTGLLQLGDDVVRRATAFTDALNPDGRKLVFGFHVRRGDYRSHRGGEYYYTDEDWQRWIRECRDLAASRHADFQGVVCSNEPVTQILADSDDLAAGPNTPYDDLAVLSRCDYLVGPPSTFSGWASFVGRRPLMVLHSADAQCRLEEFRVVDW